MTVCLLARSTYTSAKHECLIGLGVVAIALTLTVSVSAAPITLGPWLPAPPASTIGDAPWNHRSADCATCNAGFVMGLGPDWAYTTDPWAFPYTDGVVWTEVYNWTAFAHRVISQSATGAFDYQNLDTGDHYTSDGAGWDQWVLLRRPLDATTTEYLVLLEDMGMGRGYPGMGPSDRDYNDAIWRAVERQAEGGAGGPGGGGASVPEPGLALALVGLAAAAWRRR